LHAAKRQAERHQQRWALLLRVARHLAEEADPPTVLRALAEEAASIFPQAAVAVYRWDPDDEALVPVAGSRLADHFETTQLRLSEGLNGRVAAARTTCVVDDFQREIGPTAPLGQSGARASVGVPLLVEGRLLGTLAIGALSPTVRFAPADVATLELLASTAAAVFLGLERAQLKGVLLAARTAQHTLNNQLGLVVGHAELLAADPRVPADVRPLVQEILAGAEQAAATVQQLSQLTRVEPVDQGGPGPVLTLPTSQLPAHDRLSSNGR
jgi:GAF domain-containing protein